MIETKEVAFHSLTPIQNTEQTTFFHPQQSPPAPLPPRKLSHNNSISPRNPFKDTRVKVLRKDFQEINSRKICVRVQRRCGEREKTRAWRWRRSSWLILLSFSSFALHFNFLRVKVSSAWPHTENISKHKPDAHAILETDHIFAAGFWLIFGRSKINFFLRSDWFYVNKWKKK